MRSVIFSQCRDQCSSSQDSRAALANDGQETLVINTTVNIITFSHAYGYLPSFRESASPLHYFILLLLIEHDRTSR